jgi:penicillin G amidase
MSGRWRCGLVALALLASGCSGDPILVVPTGSPPLGDALPIDEQLALPGLHGWVDAVRDEQGRMHIYATDVHDAMLVEGYLVARDRHHQLDFLRRVASGRLAELLGSLDASLVQTDLVFRQIGLHRVAAEMLAQASDEEREVLEAYAAGVSLLFAELRDGRRTLPSGITFFEPEHFTPWTAIDSLSIGRLQTWLLSYGANEEIGATALLADLKATFSAADADPLLAKRAGIERDYLRFEPPSHAATLASLSEVGPASSPPEAKVSGPVIDDHLREAARLHQTALDRVRRWLAPPGDFGSNNWAVGPSRSASGYPLLASDPHLSLGSPATFWPVSIHVTHAPSNARDLHVGGIAFPGIPGIILGHNERLAWGATVAYHDVTDVYLETISPDGEGVIFEGQKVAFETVEERIDDGRGGEIVYEVKIVPHHGPIFPSYAGGKVAEPAGTALSVRWTGLEPTAELSAVLGLHRAADVDEAIASLQKFEVGGQNWMLADTSGRIGWTMHARVPYRAPKALQWSEATYEGLLPCLVLPGDGSAEWTGYWADDAVPWDVDPASGYLATANNDPVGGTFDNDPGNDLQPDGTSAYLGCRYAAGFRQARIKERLETSPLSLEDMSAIQGDHRSPLGALLTPALLLALENAQQAAVSGGYPDLTEVVADPGYQVERMAQIAADLTAWREDADYAAAAGVDLDDGQVLPADSLEGRAARATLIFNAWLVRFLGRTFGDELARVGRPNGTGDYVPALVHLVTTEPAELSTYDAASGDSALWDDLDTPAVESRQERMIRALLDALAWLDAEAGAYDDWRWGQHHTVVFAPLVPVFGTFTIPSNVKAPFRDGFPRHGDMFVVDASNYDVTRGLSETPTFRYGSGPTQRFVIELVPNGLRVHNALPGGAVADPDSPHFADQAEAWRRNETFAIPFYLDDVIAAAESRSSFTP